MAFYYKIVIYSHNGMLIA